MSSAPLEQEFVFKVDSSPIDDATRAFARGTDGAADFASTMRSVDASMKLLVGIFVGVTEELHEYTRATRSQEEAEEQYDAHVRSHTDTIGKQAAATEKAARYSKQFDDAVKHFASTARDTGPIATLISQIERVGEAAQSGVRQLVSGATDVALGFGLYDIGSKAAGFFLELPGKILESSAAAERLDKAFKFSLGPQAPQVVEWIEGMASKTQFTEDQLKGVALQMTRVGIPAAELDKDLAAALDIAVQSPEPLQAMSAAVSAFAEGARRGVINMRMLRPLGIGPDALRVLPEFSAMSDKQLRKTIDEGNLNRAQLLAVIAGADGKLGDLGLEGANDMQTKLKNIKDLPDQLRQQFAQTKSFEELKGKLDEFSTYMGPEGPGGKKAIEFLTKFEEKAVRAFGSIDWKGIAEDLVDAAGSVLKIASASAEIAAFLGKWSGVGGLMSVSAQSKGVNAQLAKEGLFPSQQTHEGKLGAAADFLNKYTPVGFLNDFAFNPEWYKRRIPAFWKGAPEVGAKPDATMEVPGAETSSPSAALRPMVPPAQPGTALVGHNVTVQNHITVHAETGSSAQEIAEKTAEHVGKTASGQFLGALQQARATGGY